MKNYMAGGIRRETALRLAKPRFNDCFNDHVTGQRVFRGNEVPRSILTKVVRIKNFQERREKISFRSLLRARRRRFFLENRDFLGELGQSRTKSKSCFSLGLKFPIIII